MSDSTDRRPRFAHVCLLVNDIQQALEDYKRILEVLDPEQSKSYAHGEFSRSGDDVYHWATFSSPNGCEVQFMQPIEGPLKRRLDKKGEHVHHLCFVSQDLEGTVGELKAKGIPLTSDQLSSDEVTIPWQSWTFVDPEISHGVLVEVARTYRTVGETWEPVTK